MMSLTEKEFFINVIIIKLFTLIRSVTLNDLIKLTVLQHSFMHVFSPHTVLSVTRVLSQFKSLRRL